MLAHLRNPRLLAIYAVGFGVLFNFIATFTYVSFHLAAPPYFFTPTLLGALFASYLGGSLVVPWVGRAIALFGRRRFVLGIIALWAAGTLMLLAPPVPVIVIGLTLCATCGLVVPGGFHRLRHHHRQGGALGGRRALRLELLYRRQRRRLSRRFCLGCRRLDRLRRHHRRQPGDHGGDRRHRVGAIARVIESRECKAAMKS